MSSASPLVPTMMLGGGNWSYVRNMSSGTTCACMESIEKKMSIAFKKKKKKKFSSVFTGYSGVRLEGIQLSQCAILRLQSSVSQTLEIRTLYRYFAYRLRKIMKTNVLSVSCWHESVVWGKIHRPMCSVSACLIGGIVFVWRKIRQRRHRKEMCCWSLCRISAFESSVLGVK